MPFREWSFVFRESVSEFRDPEGPEIEKNSFSLERMKKKKNLPARTKEPFSLQFFILGLKLSFPLEFLGQRGARNEKTILD